MTQNHTPITDPHAGVLGHASEDPELLRQCIASGQVEPDQVVQHGLAPAPAPVHKASDWRLVPVEPPLSLLPLLTAYASVDGLSERDQHVITTRLRARWAAILAALPGGVAPTFHDQQEGRDG